MQPNCSQIPLLQSEPAILCATNVIHLHSWKEDSLSPTALNPNHRESNVTAAPGTTELGTIGSPQKHGSPFPPPTPLPPTNTNVYPYNNGNGTATKSRSKSFRLVAWKIKLHIEQYDKKKGGGECGEWEELPAWLCKQTVLF